MKQKNLIILVVIFLTINFIVYTLTQINTKDRIEVALKKDMETLQTHFDILNTSQKNIAYAISQSILRNTDLIEYLSKSYTATKEQNQINRTKLYNQLKEQYRTAKKQGVLQIQFINKNNISFLRVHKPSKFGDDLSGIRKDFDIVNKTLKPVRGFTQGRTAHGFRNSFPIFDKKNNHIGAMEISFSSEKYQWYLNKVSNIHSHFLVSKSIFEAKTWAREDLVIKYTQSAESEELMVTLSGLLSRNICIENNMEKLKPLRSMIDEKIKAGDKFNFYVENIDKIEIISFLPIKNISNKTVAWIASHTKSDIIQSSLNSQTLVRSIAFILSLIIVYLLYRQNQANIKLEEERRHSQEYIKLIDKNIITSSTDLDGNITYISDAFSKISGYSKDELLGKNHRVIKHPDMPKEVYESIWEAAKTNTVWEGEIKNLKKGGGYYWVKANISPIFDESGKKIGYTAIRQDITDKKTIELISITDGLTNIYNRRHFNELFPKVIETSKRGNELICFLIMDIDHFKQYNDTYGHQMGDEVLIKVASCIKNSLNRTDDYCFRLGGEEFGVLYKSSNKDDALNFANKIRENIENLKIEHTSNSASSYVTASMGLICKNANDINSDDEVYKQADDLLYEAKESGRNKVCN